ncbi:MAG: dual specificity protein phosphatase [Leptolyngbyaceae bacterium]|nr:dual specificity protein phosphatase [Leptolyngbyaceae bacterium]
MLNLPLFQRRHKRNQTAKKHEHAFPIHWVLPQQLAVGRLPKATDTQALVKSNIQAIVALCSETEGQWPTDLDQNFYCRRIVIPDSHYSAILQSSHLATVIDHLHDCIESQLPVFVHCLAGIERSPTVCAAYLCRHRNYTLWESLSWLKQVHPNSLPTEQQIQAIREYLKDCTHTIA